MISKGVATFTLDWGKCPPWLFRRMVSLGREIVRIIVEEEGPEEFVRRMGDPVWFQSLGTVLAFDWNASGLTTTLTAALKEAIKGREEELGVYICGGKGKTSRKTPEEIEERASAAGLSDKDSQNLVYNSRMSAKVDSCLLQDGYQIYHHTFIFSKSGSWTVVQQGMNTSLQTARRYHWHSGYISDMLSEPHSGISTQKVLDKVLDLTSSKSIKNRDVSYKLLSSLSFKELMKDLAVVSRHKGKLSQMIRMKDRHTSAQLTLLDLKGCEFKEYDTLYEDFSANKYLQKVIYNLTLQKPNSFKQVLSTQGVGPKTVRALSLVAEVIYGAKPSYEDPARYSFAHGGKDGSPYFVDRKTYDYTIQTFKKYISKSRISRLEKVKIIERLDKKKGS